MQLQDMGFERDKVDPSLCPNSIQLPFEDFLPQLHLPPSLPCALHVRTVTAQVGFACFDWLESAT
jgi:hypothetical protein